MNIFPLFYLRKIHRFTNFLENILKNITILWFYFEEIQNCD